MIYHNYNQRLILRLTKNISSCMKFDPTESVDSTTKVRAYKILRGHKASVQSVSAQKSGNMVCCYPFHLTCVLQL